VVVLVEEETAGRKKPSVRTFRQMRSQDGNLAGTCGKGVGGGEEGGSREGKQERKRTTYFYNEIQVGIMRRRRRERLRD